MRRFLFLMLSVSLLWSVPFAAGQSRQGPPAPFTDILFEERGIMIEVDGVWYKWLGLDGHDIAAIEQTARTFGENMWQKRLAEDLSMVLSRLGHRHGPTVTLDVQHIEGGERISLRDVAMTAANRTEVWTRRHNRERDETLHRYGIDQALRELTAMIATHHAYANMKGLNLNELVQLELKRLGDQPRYDAVVLAAHRLVCKLGDGHAGIRNWLSSVPAGRSDVLLQEVEGGIVAYRRPLESTRGSLLVEGYPFVVSIDGLPIEHWIDAAAAYVTDGSPALIRRRAIELLRYVNLVRDEMGLQHVEELAFVLRNASGDEVTQHIAISEERALYGTWPRISAEAMRDGFDTRMIESGRVGYIRVVEMGDEAAAAALMKRVGDMLNAKGLVIDVRGNGGGSRAILRALLPMVMPQSHRLVNIAARRLPPTEPRPADGWLANRYLYPVSWHGWSDAQRSVIDTCVANFSPQWQPPQEQFSDWHVMVVSREPGGMRFEGPVVVLMDGGCFSATDIFLGAFKGVQNVTLMGMPSSGGSARSASHNLIALQCEVRLASMASFQPDGRLYDTNGIEPDVQVMPTVGDVLGESDTLLDAAVKHLQQR